MKKPRLENWSLKGELSDPDMAPEQGIPVLVGTVYDHPSERHPNGKRIRTTRVLELDTKKKTAKTQSRSNS